MSSAACRHQASWCLHSYHRHKAAFFNGTLFDDEDDVWCWTHVFELFKSARQRGMPEVPLMRPVLPARVSMPHKGFHHVPKLAALRAPRWTSNAPPAARSLRLSIAMMVSSNTSARAWVSMQALQSLCGSERGSTAARCSAFSDLAIPVPEGWTLVVQSSKSCPTVGSAQLCCARNPGFYCPTRQAALEVMAGSGTRVFHRAAVLPAQSRFLPAIRLVFVLPKE